MKKLNGIVVVLLWLQFVPALAQDKEPTKMFSIYEDNDCLTLTGTTTDNAYTNGTSFNYYIVKPRSIRFFIDRWMPKAGKMATNISSWKLTQLMVTPDDITKTTFQPDDYPYSGALFLTHGLSSYNASKKYSLSTDIILGIRGPASFAQQVQEFIHNLLDFEKPRGWGSQLKTSPLVNINFTAEKQLLKAGNFLEIIGGTQIAVGSFTDAFSIYPLIRIGHMSLYFDGLFRQFGSFERANRKSNAQFYIVIKPATTWVLHDALFYGESENKENVSDVVPRSDPARQIRHRVTDLQYGAVLAYNRFSLSYLTTLSTEYNSGLYHHNFANITASVCW